MGTQKKKKKRRTGSGQKGAASSQPPGVFRTSFPKSRFPHHRGAWIGHRAFTIRAIVTFKALALYRKKL